MGKGESSTPATTQTVQKSDPWSGIQPYLLGTGGTAARPAGWVTQPGVATSGRYEDVGDSGSRYIPGTSSEGTKVWDPGDPGTPATGGLYPSAAKWFASSTPEYYQGNTVAQFTPDQIAAMDKIRTRANSGLGTMDNTLEMLQKTSKGDFLNANPYLDAMFDNASRGVTKQFKENVMPGIASMYSEAGRYGSGAMTTATGAAGGALGDSLAGMSAEIYGGNYQQERNRQMQAAGLMPVVSAAQFDNDNALFGLGQTQQGMDQANIDADRNKWDFNQNKELMKLQQYAQLLSGGLGAGGTTTTNGTATSEQQPKNKMAGAIGGAATGMSVAGPWGALAGLVLGGLM